jgi:hypothetical protein
LLISFFNFYVLEPSLSIIGLILATQKPTKPTSHLPDFSNFPVLSPITEFEDNQINFLCFLSDYNFGPKTSKNILRITAAKMRKQQKKNYTYLENEELEFDKVHVVEHLFPTNATLGTQLK